MGSILTFIQRRLLFMLKNNLRLNETFLAEIKTP